MKRAALALSLALIALTAPASSADHALSLEADARDRGYVGLRMHADAGEPVSIRDETTGRTRTLTPASEETRLRRFEPWSCKARTRRFTVTQGELTATAAVRTPSCARRLEATGPARTR